MEYQLRKEIKTLSKQKRGLETRAREKKDRSMEIKFENERRRESKMAELPEESSEDIEEHNKCVKLKKEILILKAQVGQHVRERKAAQKE